MINALIWPSALLKNDSALGSLYEFFTYSAIMLFDPDRENIYKMILDTYESQVVRCFHFCGRKYGWDLYKQITNETGASAKL